MAAISSKKILPLSRFQWHNRKLAAENIQMKKLISIIIAIAFLGVSYITYGKDLDSNKTIAINRKNNSNKYLSIQLKGPTIDFTFIYHGGLGSKIYKNPMVGVDILEMSVDGKILKPIETLFSFDAINYSIINIKSDKYIYLTGAMLFNEKDSYLIFVAGNSKTYHIPKNATNILIKYNINLPTKKHSDPQVLEIRLE